ncbi:MAG TPA: hypothetical protein VGN18_14160 [Jatrophihabitans sp.]|jgi:hypothetical protein|uniref:hypothetical protein n=1 Tax=Jatrophihabitans sp. TaxID=1932789 RepID=UPI002E0005EC|nr:hypothetical protein [Jatrophihabitans sp.]
MFHPVGSRPPSVYWRRRLVLIGSAVLIVALLVLTLRALTSGDGTPSGAGTAAGSTSRAASPSPSPTSTAANASSGSSSHSASVSSSKVASSSVPPALCAAAGLEVQAVVAKSNYQVGDRPVVELQVTNTGARPCVQDLADQQVELKVYNGESRVWGSHDCEVQPGTNERTLAPGQPVRVSITWSGLTSQPKCAGTRQRVGAGTYTLYASLSGRTGKAAQFAIS